VFVSKDATYEAVPEAGGGEAAGFLIAPGVARCYAPIFVLVTTVVTCIFTAVPEIESRAAGVPTPVGSSASTERAVASIESFHLARTRSSCATVECWSALLSGDKCKNNLERNDGVDWGFQAPAGDVPYLW